MIEARRIAEVLGGAKVLGHRVGSLLDLNETVAKGLPKSALRACANRVYTAPREQIALVYTVVPEATYKRRRQHLSPRESERTERLARVIATAEYVWDDREDARAFLTTPHPALGGKRPIDHSSSELGARQVEELLWQMFHGLAA
jgi:putative toxin-antitoxin system antitoxin component (TIGR02293 family)